MPEVSPLRAALVGCGKIGWEFQDDPGASRFGICTHAAAWSTLSGVQLVAVADSDAQKALRCAARWQVPAAYQDMGQLLEESKPDIVSIATPDHNHCALVRQCLESTSVRAILAEKPLAATPQEAAELDALSGRLGKTIVVNYSRRFCAFYVALKARIQNGEFGQLHLARSLYTKGLRHNASHCLDLLSFFFGAMQPLSAAFPSWAHEDSHDADPGLDVALASAGGGRISLHNLPSQQYTLFELDLCFEKARFIFTDGGDTVQEFALVNDQPFTNYTSLAQTVRHENAMRDYLLHGARHVVSILHQGAANVSTAADSVALLKDCDTLSTLRV